jgi:glycolate oxidase
MALTEIILDELIQIVGPSEVLTDKEDLITYSYDGTATLQQMPAAVVFPKTTEQISRILVLANRTRTPVVTRGSGTGLSGGSVPISGCLVLCLVKMDHILELDRKNLTLLTECGVTTQAIADAVSAAGLFYPPDPGSMRISTIGGNVAENSGGLRGLKYGVTRNYVMGMEVVLPEGEIVWMGNKCVKDVAGYNLKDLFIGSEGTLCIITKVLLRLIPKPATKKTMVATFRQMDQAAEAVSAIIANQIIPCTLEFLDRTTIHCVEDYAHIGLPLDCEALVLMETDGHAQVVAQEAERMEQICREQGCVEIRVARDEAEAVQLASARRTAFSALARVSPTTILEDVTVPRSELGVMIRFIQATAAKFGLKMGVFGHMGDGNLHPTVLTDERNHEEMQRVEAAFDAIFKETIRLGGTVTGEHGVGLAKKAILPLALGNAQIGLMQALRRQLDPHQILNPGKMVDA